ncbi:MAG: hypothetical protein LQ344_007137 [Seirophora lacunosa]|nr:MAG: hypothetical protein LQ344_007137 [Seirophora lacunosa]
MSAGFGFSVGDLVLGLKLIKQSIEALEDTKGSSADYQALSLEIDSLKDGLEAVEDLRLDQRFGPKSKACVAVQDAVSRCQRCIDVFLSTITKYQPWLRTVDPSGSAWKANLKKIQWALCKKDDVSRFRAQLERHSSSISMLLVTLQVSQSFEHSEQQKNQQQFSIESHGRSLALQKQFDQTTALLLSMNIEQRQLFQSLVESNRQLVHANAHMAYELQQMRGAVQLQLELPPQVLLQKPVTLLDACGKVSAFHLDFINCAEAFLAVLRIRFQQYGVNDRAIRMLDESQFVLEDHNGKLDLSRPWLQVLKPNQRINMSMVFYPDEPLDECPACRSESHGKVGMPIECLHCGLYYKRARERLSLNIRYHSSATCNDYDLRRARYLSTREPSHLIDQFRRVQLVDLDHRDTLDQSYPSMLSRPKVAKRRPQPRSKAAASGSPFHLFDMSAALLNRVESNQQIENSRPASVADG